MAIIWLRAGKGDLKTKWCSKEPKYDNGYKQCWLHALYSGVKPLSLLL